MIQLAASITAFTLAVLMIPVVIKYLERWQLVDKPGKRKVHVSAKPSFGGLPIFVSFLFASLLWVNLTDWKRVKYTLLAQGIIIIFGFRDDLFPLRPIHKLIGQLLAACVVIFLADFRIQGLYGFMGIHEIPLVLSYVITLFALIGITNSFNLIDGLDGLAGFVAAIIFLTLGIWLYAVGDNIFAILCFALLGALLGFLIFNWQPSSIFMGDTGSLFIGLTISMFIIRFMNMNYNLPVEHPLRFESTIGMASCIIIIPLVDTMRIIILRLYKGHSPFRPDKSHIHHAIMRLGLTHSRATLILVGVQLMFISLAIVFSSYGDKIVVVGIVALAVVLCVILDRLIIGRVVR